MYGVCPQCQTVTSDRQCAWYCPICQRRCGGIEGHEGGHQCAVHSGEPIIDLIKKKVVIGHAWSDTKHG